MSTIKQQAARELAHEARRRAVDAEKARLLRRKRFWARILPFTITWKKP